MLPQNNSYARAEYPTGFKSATLSTYLSWQESSPWHPSTWNNYLRNNTEIARQLPAQLWELKDNTIPCAFAGCQGLTGCSYFSLNVGDPAPAWDLHLPACGESQQGFPGCQQMLGHRHKQHRDIPKCWWSTEAGHKQSRWGSYKSNSLWEVTLENVMTCTFFFICCCNYKLHKALTIRL